MKQNLFSYDTFCTPSILEHFKIDDLETASAVRQQNLLVQTQASMSDFALVKG